MNTQQLQAIAMRIRELREVDGLSLAQTAAACNVTERQMRAIETGTVDIPISLLYSLCGLYHVEMTALLTGEEPKLHIYSLVRAGRGVDVDRRKEYKYQSLAYKFQQKKAEPFYVTVDPQPEGTPISLNSHTGHECDYMLEGSMRVIIGDTELILMPGDCLYFDSSHPHGMQAFGENKAAFLAIVL